MRCERISLGRALFVLAGTMTLVAAGLAASLPLQRTPCFSREVAR